MPFEPAHPQEKGTIVSVTKYVPFPGIGHAGGEYSLQHYAALSATHTIALVAPYSELNRTASTRPGAPEHVLLTSRWPLADPRLKLFADLQSVARGSSAHRWFERAVLANTDTMGRLAGAQIIEHQWSEVASLAPALRKRLPAKPQVIIAHDVITQRWRRAAAMSGSVARRVAFDAAARLSARRESRSFAAADAVVVFSEKDADLVRELAPSARAEVVHPGFTVPEQSASHLESREKVVLFTGAMSRPDNDDAARWFLQEIWPTVAKEVPGARFVIAGSKPTRALSQIASASPRVELTGYVDSLEPYFNSARLAVVPLRTGAGVKFKTIDAMLRGIPVITTTVGAEGIERSDLLSHVSDDPHALARAVIDELSGPPSRDTAAVQKWATATYGFDAFQSRLASLYDDIIESARHGRTSPLSSS